jgi:NAD(P)-dependent dehydrogenase (short-subunit alcohol dehydrogenase family)
VSLLVNNASAFHDDRFGSLGAHWDEHFDVNLRAPVLLAQAFAKALPADLDGLIVNILDQRVWRPNPQFFSYTLAKSALWTATQTMAQQLGPRIRVNAIGPGPTLPSVHQSGADFETEVKGVILQRKVSPADIAAALRYLIEASSVTGQMIAVDAGQHLAWKTPDIVGE